MRTAKLEETSETTAAAIQSKVTVPVIPSHTTRDLGPRAEVTTKQDKLPPLAKIFLCMTTKEPRQVECVLNQKPHHRYCLSAFLVPSNYDGLSNYYTLAMFSEDHVVLQ